MPSTTTPSAPSGNNGATISSVLGSILHPASSSNVNVLSAATAPNVDTADAASVAAVPSAGDASFVSGTTIVGHHAFPVLTGAARTAAARRHADDNATNSPWDLTYFGGPVLGSAISDDVFVNCTASCRQSQALNPGQFLVDLSGDEYVSLLYQYLASPGVTISTPLSGRYTKGVGADVTFTPGSGNVFAGFANPVLLPGDLIGILVQGINATGGLDAHHNRIYHLFLPPNYDTCFDASVTRCYSPDNPNAYVFCAYHAFATTSTGFPVYFTVEPDQDVPGCQPLTNLPLPNQVGNNRRTDATDSTLSHELFETISDPQLSAWFNGLSGNEIGDLCSAFDNFVTVGGEKYIIQSEYSDIGQECVSANLTNGTAPLTP